LLAGFRNGWLLSQDWPLNFHDGRDMGVGLLLWILLFTFPFLDELMRRDTLFMLLVFVAIAFAVQDFWLPRWSMTLILALVLLVGGALAWFAANGPRLIAVILTLAVVLHLGRPIYDAYSMIEKERWYIRANLSDSPLFISSEIAPGVVQLYPDLDADLLIARPVPNGFVLPLYGRQLSNEIVGIVTPDQVDETCVIQGASTDPSDRHTLIVDQRGTLAQQLPGCLWVCEVQEDGICLAGKVADQQPYLYLFRYQWPSLARSSRSMRRLRKVSTPLPTPGITSARPGCSCGSPSVALGTAPRVRSPSSPSWACFRPGRCPWPRSILP
jgi:hypothetical protein